MLITGGAGFIGSRVLAALDAVGAEMHCVILPGESTAGGITHTVDLRDEDRTREIIAAVQPAVVFHLAGIVDTSRASAHVMRTLQGNLIASVNVLLGALDAGVERVVMVGSSEELAGATSSPYAASKLALRPWIELFSSAYGLDITTVRPFMAYGPGQPGHRLIPEVILHLLAGLSPTIRDPRRVCDFVFVRDVVSGLLTAGVASSCEAGDYDLGTGIGTRISDACEQISTLIPGAPAVTYLDAPPSSQPHVAFASGRRLPDWEPSVTLAEGLAQTVAWYHARHSGDSRGEVSR